MLFGSLKRSEVRGLLGALAPLKFVLLAQCIISVELGLAQLRLALFGVMNPLRARDREREGGRGLSLRYLVQTFCPKYGWRRNSQGDARLQA